MEKEYLNFTNNSIKKEPDVQNNYHPNFTIPLNSIDVPDDDSDKNSLCRITLLIF